jgi:tetratricopeptide (TPR) repeat protein
MGASQKAKDAYAKYKKYKKAKGYYETIKKIIDEDTRSSEVFKLGVKALTKLGDKVVGQSISKHPYFAYHKIHLEALGKALTASDTHRNAMDALRKAIEAADHADALATQIEELKKRKQGLKHGYAWRLQMPLRFLIDARTNPTQAAADAKDMGQSLDAMIQETARRVEDDMYAWRGETCALFYDAVDLLAMVEIEAGAASAAFARYTEKVAKLQKSKNSIDYVAGKAAEYQKQLEQASRELDQIYSSKKTPAPEAVADPSLHARRQRDRVEEVVNTLATFCDGAMSDDAYNPDALSRQIGSL